MIKKHKLNFDILWDHNNELAKQFGLAFDVPDDLIEVYQKFGIDLPGDQGVDGWTLPMPGRFVIDSGGVIRSVDSDPDYRFRPEPQATVDFVATLIPT